MEKTRQELFEFVWSMPVTKLSKQFELSDVGLRKICIKHQIPLPLQGHWTRKQFGKEAPRPALQVLFFEYRRSFFQQKI
jgi:hypothetical protein